MLKKDPQAPIKPIQQLKIPSIDQLHKLQVANFMYQVENQTAPKAFDEFFDQQKQKHQHNTRSASQGNMFKKRPKKAITKQ